MSALYQKLTRGPRSVELIVQPDAHDVVGYLLWIVPTPADVLLQETLPVLAAARAIKVIFLLLSLVNGHPGGGLNIGLPQLLLSCPNVQARHVTLTSEATNQALADVKW